MPTITIQRSGQPPERRDIRAPSRAGGSHADDVHLPGCPPGALTLLPCAAGLVAEAVSCGVRAAGHPLPPGDRRLLRAGERVELHGWALSVEPLGDEGTRAAAGALLRDAAVGAAPLAGAHLLVLSGPAAGARHPLREDQTIGRGRAATIVIPDPNASRIHARLRLGADGAAIEDLRSKNGVRVDGQRIERRPCPLRPGDEIGIGATALVLLGAAAPPGQPPAGRGRPGRRPARRAVAAALLALSAAALALAAR